MPMRLILLFGLVVLFSCRNKDLQTSDSNVRNISTDSVLLNGNQESKDRDVWQNPNYIISILGDLSDKTVADLGAGSGYFSFKMLQKAKKVIALDIDRHSIQYMNQKVAEYPQEIRNKFEARQVEDDDPKLMENEVQLVLVANTYIYIQDRINYFSRLRKALTPGGKLYIIDFKKDKMPVGPSDDIRLSSAQVVSELSEAGFSNINANDSALKYQYIISAENTK